MDNGSIGSRDEFDGSVDKAERYMRVAERIGRFRKLRNLKISVTTLYQLADEDERYLPAIIDELVKHTTNSRLKSGDAERVMNIAIGRCRIGDGDYPDATLALLGKLDEHSGRYEKLLVALQEHRPDTDEAANSIVKEVIAGEFANHREAANVEGEEEVNDEAEETESILDGAPPVLPPPTTPSEPQKLGAHTEWAGTVLFEDAVNNLLSLRAKPVGRFVGIIPPADLNEVARFLLAVAAADKKEPTPVAATELAQ
jgi:hypothetical protein